MKRRSFIKKSSFAAAAIAAPILFSSISRAETYYSPPSDCVKKSAFTTCDPQGLCECESVSHPTCDKAPLCGSIPT